MDGRKHAAYNNNTLLLSIIPINYTYTYWIYIIYTRVVLQFQGVGWYNNGGQ